MSVVPPFDKYAAYQAAVQSPREDARFLRRVYRELRGREPVVLREDFCSTFTLCCEWVRLHKANRAVGVDIDPEPLRYGEKHYASMLSESQQRRVSTLQRDVMKSGSVRADIVCALNFSYFLFKSRQSLVRYFERCQSALSADGILAVDAFGGPFHEEPNVHTRRLRGLTYYFEQETFDPITRHARFSIHFKPTRGRTHKRAFTYDWRLWSIAEIRDAMIDAGFARTHVYWEGTTRQGVGNGVFSRKESGEPCQAWVAYIIALR
jgi:hypothetical protein